jgi:transposase
MYFAGLDAHLKYVSVAVLNKMGVVTLETSVSTREPEQLLAALAPYRPLDVVVETCPFWPWLYDLLVPAGIGFHLAHAKQLRAIAAAPQKSDAVDARLLGRMLLAGLIPEAYPRAADQRDLLRLLRHRTTLVRYRTRLASRIHSQLHQQRLSLPREQLLRQATRAWLQETAWPRLTVEQRAIVTTHLELIDRLTPLIRALERRIATAAAGHATAPLLATIPGIGPYRSLLLAAELGPITRFPRVEHVVSYAGLAPVTRSSGGHTHHGSIPQGANRWVRGALVSAIPTHVRSAPTSPVTVAYEQLKARLGWRVARVAAARKLVRIVYVMLCRREPWGGTQELTTSGTRSTPNLSPRRPHLH